MNPVITNLEDLKKFNQQYILGCSIAPELDKSKHPILYDWFLDYFFDIALKDLSLAKESFYEFVTFSQICENIPKDYATGRCINSLNYWADRASKNIKDYKKFKADYL